MSNFTPVNVEYNSTSILHAIPDYDSRGARPCSGSVINKINSLLNLKYPADEMLYFSMGPKRQGEIHVDENYNVNVPVSTFALNLPLLNSQETDMRWFRKKHASIPDSFNTGVYHAKFKILDYSNAECIDMVSYTQPTIVNISDYHSVENRSNEPSCFISLRFNCSITKELLISSLQD